MIMLKNYLNVALRTIKRQKAFSFIKIFGLSVGIAVCILIYLFVVDELSTDKFHKNGEWLYRFVQVRYDKETEKQTGLQQFIPPAVGPELQRVIPEIQHQSRFVNGSCVVRYEDKIFRESVFMADSPFFEMFTFPLIYGDPKTALPNDQSIVLTQSFAQKYFGEKNPMGMSLTLTFGQERKDFFVTGVAEDVPNNSSIQFNLLIHFNNLPTVMNNPDILQNWERWYSPLFVQLDSESSVEVVEERLDQFCRQYFGFRIQEYIDSGYDPFTFGLQPVKSMYLDTRIFGNAGLAPSYLLSVIALAILLIACVNYMNLAIGESSRRSMEVGMRKVLGAQRRQLIRQFSGEALLISFFAILLGLLFAEGLLPKFNDLSGKMLSLNTLFDSTHILILLLIAVFTGLCAGSYPAFILSAFRPVDIMKGKLRVGGRTTLTKGLIVLQFALSVVLVISAIILGRQTSFLISRNPGFVSEGLVGILTQENEQQESEKLYQLFRNEVSSHSQIQSLTASNRDFGVFLPGTSIELDNRKLHFRFNRVDPNFLSTLKIKLIQGRDFSSNSAADRDAVIVNQRFIDELGPGYKLGETLGDVSKGFPFSSRIVGVVENCFVASLRSEMEPMLLYVGKGAAPNRDRFSRIFVRIGTDDITGTMGYLEKAWKKIQPNKPFLTYFQEDALRNLYNREKRWSAIVQYASVFCILLACLGIFGLTAMTLSRREKEIGIRKVLGARLEQIVYLGMKEFIVLIALANVIAWPIVYLIMRKVLQNYPNRITIGFHYFLIAGAASILIAVFTILYLSIKAALANPAESLKYE